MDTNELVKKVSGLLSQQNLLNRSGAVLYSAAKTITKGDVYILGLNPGGTQGPTLAEHLEKLPAKIDNDYLATDWGNRDGTLAPLQIRLAELLKVWNHYIEDVCASNLIFMQSRDASGIQFPEDAALCWPVHEKLLEIVQPKRILVFGNSSRSPYRFLFDKFGSNAFESIILAGHGNWKCRSFVATHLGRKVRVYGLPHLSRYSPLDSRGKVKEHIVEWLTQD